MNVAIGSPMTKKSPWLMPDLMLSKRPFLRSRDTIGKPSRSQRRNHGFTPFKEQSTALAAGAEARVRGRVGVGVGGHVSGVIAGVGVGGVVGVFFFNDTATTGIYTLSLHDALPIWALSHPLTLEAIDDLVVPALDLADDDIPLDHVEALVRRHLDTSSAESLRKTRTDRKSTRLNSSHQIISYAVFCLKKKNNKTNLHHSD